jgi:fatty-acyl-CoA synthase
VYYGTPNIALALWEHPDRPRRDLSSLRTGAAIGPPPAMQMVMDLGVREICNVYGLTECYGNSHVTDAADPADVRLHSVGRPLPGMEIRIVDRDTRQPLPPGEVGEILIRGHLTPATTRTRSETPRRSTRRGSSCRATSAWSTATAACTSAGASRRW